MRIQFVHFVQADGLLLADLHPARNAPPRGQLETPEGQPLEVHVKLAPQGIMPTLIERVATLVPNGMLLSSKHLLTETIV